MADYVDSDEYQPRPAAGPRVYGGGIWTRSTLYSYQVARLKKDVKNTHQKLDDVTQELANLRDERDQLRDERDRAVRIATPLAAMAQKARVATAGGVAQASEETALEWSFQLESDKGEVGGEDLVPMGRMWAASTGTPLAASRRLLRDAEVWRRTKNLRLAVELEVDEEMADVV